MAENATISDLSKVIQSISNNTGVLSDIADVCSVIKNLKLQRGDNVIVKEKTAVIKSICNNSLNSIFVSLDKLNSIKTSLNLSSLNTFKNNFDILSEYITVLCDSMLEFRTKFNKKSGDDLMKILQNLIGWDETKLIKDNINNTHSGVFNVLTSYINAINNLFKKDGIVNTINNIKPVKVNKNNIQKIFDSISEYFDVVVKGLYDVATDDTKQLVIMYGVDVTDNLSSIFSSVKSIVESTNSILDIKKNPLINPGKMLFAKQAIKKTFNSIIDISDYTYKQLESLGDKLSNDDKYGEKVTKDISSIFSSVKSIVESINDLVDIKKNPFINPGKMVFVKQAIRIVISSILDVSEYMYNQLEKLSKNLNKQKLEKLDKVVESIHKITQNITDILKNFISMPLLILKFTLAATIIIPGIVLLQVLLLAIITSMQAFRLIDKFANTVKNSTEGVKQIIQDLKSIFWDIIKLSLLTILLVPAMVIITAAMPIVAIGVSAILLGIFAISKLFNLINNLGLKHARRASRRILLLIANITLICASIILFAITIIPLIKILIAGILAIVLIFTMLALAIKVMSLVSKLMKFKDFLSISLTLLAVSLITIALIGISILLVLLQEQAKQIDVLTIVLFMVGFIVFVAVLAALGYACVVASPILIPAAIAIVLLAAVTLIVVGSLLLIAYLLNKLSNISLDSEAIKNTVNVIFETANDIINAIFQNPRKDPEGSEKESWWSSALKWLGDSTVGKLFKSLMTVVYLAQIVAAVYLIKWIADCLNQLQNIQLDRVKVNEGVGIVLSTADSIIQRITTYKNKDFKDAHKNLVKYENVINVMVGIQNKLDRISNRKNIVDSCMDLITVVSRFNDSFNKINEKKTINAVKEYTNFLKQVDSMNLNKLETTVRMFEEMARFSESINGNFESLADALNEKIAPLLEELKELIGGLPENTARANQQVNQQNNTNTTTEQGYTVPQTNTTGPINQQNNTNTTTEQVNQQTNTNTTTEQGSRNSGYENYWSDNIEGIINELTSIKNMFLNGEAQVKTL